MRIAQLAPLAESVPPKLYGGTERVVAWLVDELVELGHDVTLFASGELQDERKAPSRCGRARCASGERVRIPTPPAPFCWRRSPSARRLRRDPLPHRLVAASAAQPARRAVPDDDARSAGSAGTADVVREFSGRSLRLDIRRPAPAASGGELDRHDPARTARDLFRPSFEPGFVPRFPGAADGGERTGGRHPDRAAPPECRCASPPRFRAARPAYFKKQLEPHIDGESVQLVGEVDDAKKQPFLANASGTAVSDRLARAVRSGDDRGDGVRDARDRLSIRLGAGSRRGRRDGLHRRERGAGDRGRWANLDRLTEGWSAPGSRSASPQAGWRGSTSAPTETWLPTLKRGGRSSNA